MKQPVHPITFDVAERIREHGVGNNSIDIVGLQEIENFGALLDFVQGSVGPDYGPKTGVVSIPSNDPRGIDLGMICTKNFKVGRVVSHRYKKFRRSDGKLYQFGRDCLQVEIMDKDQSGVLLTVFVCHLKSKYTGIDQFKEPDRYAAAQALNTIKRKAEAEQIVRIITEEVDIESDLFVILGDLNDTPNSESLEPLLGDGNPLGLSNALALVEQDDDAPHSDTRRPRDTHVWNRPLEDGSRQPEWAQIDFILPSKKLWSLRTGAADVINSPKDQGSNHFLSFVEFNLPD